MTVEIASDYRKHNKVCDYVVGMLLFGVLTTVVCARLAGWV